MRSENNDEQERGRFVRCVYVVVAWQVPGKCRLIQRTLINSLPLPIEICGRSCRCELVVAAVVCRTANRVHRALVVAVR